MSWTEIYNKIGQMYLEARTRLGLGPEEKQYQHLEDNQENLSEVVKISLRNHRRALETLDQPSPRYKLLVISSLHAGKPIKDPVTRTSLVNSMISRQAALDSVGKPSKRTTKLIKRSKIV